MERVSVRLTIECFNPRPREGATRRAARDPPGIAGFNPRPREGATPSQAIRDPGRIRFNPRPREGATSRTTA